MIGTILALLPLYLALFALFWRQKPKDAPKTQARPVQKFVTHEELDEAIEKAAKRLEWEWTEMYEKFNTLHLRLAKRANRQRKVEEEQEHVEQEEQEPAQLSILPYRRLGSP